MFRSTFWGVGVVGARGHVHAPASPGLPVRNLPVAFHVGTNTTTFEAGENYCCFLDRLPPCDLLTHRTGFTSKYKGTHLLCDLLHQRTRLMCSEMQPSSNDMSDFHHHLVFISLQLQ